MGGFIRGIYNADILIKQAIDQQNKMEMLLRNLDAYRPQKRQKTV